MTFPQYPGRATELEDQVLSRWREEDLFRRTLEHTATGEEFVFFEGPPTANGRPGIHHVLSRTIKDLVCRYQTMRGRHVTRIAGWDTHGLPVEIEAERKLGISGKKQIEDVGVARFNEVCRESVFTYKEDWERLSERIGYWLDYSRPYVTFEPAYIESVWSILARLHEKGLIYRGYKSVPYCPRCGTVLSSHEVAQGYLDVADPSIYFMAPLADDASRAFLVWTTTPWTLPSNVALALHPDLEYVDVEVGASPDTSHAQVRRCILAAERVEPLFGDQARILRRYRAHELAGLRYQAPFDLVTVDAPTPTTWTVVLEAFVTAGEGTGVVHLAPAFGADDYAAGQRHGLPVLRPVDDAGRFQAGLAGVGGLFVKDADPVLVEDLRRRGLVFRYSLEVHTYPHCWRCTSPLLYMARDSWYIRTTAVREAMLSNNRAVSWYPMEVGTGRFGEWLAGNVDWAISRERYWGTPLPIWLCTADREHVEVIGSFAQLAARAGGLPEPFDPHKPFLDELTWPCAACSGTMRRSPEVIDVWFDSGAMPYAQWHYPFENQAEWRRHFPADFICEGVDQTRGWFYSLMAISTMLGDGPAYRNVVVNDLVLDADGQKMSKSRGNVVDPWSAIATFGADAIRWYFLTSSQPWVPKRFDPAALGEAARRSFDTLANTYRFFALYANLEGWAPGDLDPAVADRAVMDRWITARLADVTAEADAALAAYDITRAGRALADFIVDDLSNWYVRRSRERFWGGADAVDTRAAFRTLHEVLQQLARLLAPFAPFHADWLHRALSEGASVHLERYPDADTAWRDPALEEGMRLVRVLARLGRAARDSIRVRVRQPLRTLHAVVAEPGLLTPELALVLKDELNVKEVRFLHGAADLVRLRAQPNFRQLGRRFGKETEAAAAAVRALDDATLRQLQRGAAVEIELHGTRHVVEPADVQLLEEATSELAVESDGTSMIALDPAIDEELRLEGLAREVVNRVQRLRKDAGLEVSDRIRLGIFGSGELLLAVERHGGYIAQETLATELQRGEEATDEWRSEAQVVDVDGMSARIAVLPAAM